MGIVFRNDLGQVLKVEAIPIPTAKSAAMVEALGFCDAVKLARDGFGDVVEGDAQEVVQMLYGLKSACSSLSVVITDTINLACHFFLFIFFS